MTVFFRAGGGDITTAPAPRSDADSALYAFLSEKTGLAISHDPEVFVDYEDWMEPACMLEQAIHSELEIKILPRHDLRRAVMNPVAVIPGKPCRDFLIGRQIERDPMDFRYFDLGWPAAGEERASHYAELETFWKHAGRKLALADMPGDREAAGNRKTVFGKGLSSTALGDAMTSFAPGEIIVKQVYPSKSLPLRSYSLDREFSASKGESMFFEDVGYHFARFEGDPAALLVQEMITMTHETRFFVIGGKVVSGAACIEGHTPMQTPHWDDVLPPVWEITRNSGDMDRRDRTPRKRTALQLWQYAWSVVGEITAEAPDLDVYVLDVALNADGEPIVIELNLASSSGLYANNAIKLFDAIHAYAESAPHREVESWDPDAFVGIPEGKPNPFARLAVIRDEILDDLEDEPFEDDDIVIDAHAFDD